jgi:hypothetical protein
VEGGVIVFLPIRTVSEANRAGSQHWRVRHKRAKEQRGLAAMLARNTFGKAPSLPLTITLTRIAPRELDDDNLSSSQKHVRDGLADWLGVDDRSKQITWVYRQERGAPRTYGVRVEVST